MTYAEIIASVPLDEVEAAVKAEMERRQQVAMDVIFGMFEFGSVKVRTGLDKEEVDPS